MPCAPLTILFMVLFGLLTCCSKLGVLPGSQSNKYFNVDASSDSNGNSTPGSASSGSNSSSNSGLNGNGTSPSDSSGVVAGNGYGYGIVRMALTTPQNKPVTFSISPTAQEPVESFKIITPPAHGQMQAVDNVQASYQPSPLFVGVDTFVYLYQKGTTTTQVNAFVDVSPCLKPSQYQRSPATHVIAVGSGTQTAGSIPVVKVTVKAESAPSTLVLASMDIVKWEITLAQGARLAAVTLRSPDTAHTSLAGIDASVPVIRVQTSTFGSAWESEKKEGDFPWMMAAIRSDLNAQETTFQGCPQGIEFQIPYDAASLNGACGPEKRPTVASHYNVATQKCNDKCIVPKEFDTAATTWSTNYQSSDIHLSHGDLTAMSSGNGKKASIGNVMATTGKRCGKWYFEVLVDRIGNDAYKPFIGIGSLRLDLSSENSSDWRSAGRAIDDPNLKTADVLGVELDLDVDLGQLIVTRNGVPISTGKPLSDIIYSIYFPVLNLSGQDSVTANFGKTPFVYQPPSGYQPWTSADPGATNGGSKDNRDNKDKNKDDKSEPKKN